MAWPTFLALVQVIGCPAADADRVGALIDLELAGSAAEAVEVRCGAQTTIVVRAKGETRTRTLPSETLMTDGGHRLIAVVVADLADALQRQPNEPAVAVVPVAPAAPVVRAVPVVAPIPPPAPRWQLAAVLAGRTQFDALRLGFGVVGRWIDAGRMLEVAGVYNPKRQQSGGAILDTEAQLAQFAAAAGYLWGPDDELQIGGVFGWSAGWGWLSGVARSTESERILTKVHARAIDGPVGGPFLGARILHRFGRGMVGLNVNQGWAAWTLRGRVFGEPREQFDGIWLGVLMQFGVEL